MMSEFKRQHPIAAVTKVIDLIRQNLVTIIILLFISSTGSNGYFWYFLIGGILIALIGGIFGWWLFKYRLFEDEIQIKRGIFIRNKLYLSKDRIQVIDITEGLLQRFFGLVQVEIKTAGSGTETATISAITREEAEELRSELRRDKSPTQDEISAEEFTDTAAAEDEIEATWELSNRDLLYAAFTSGNFGLIASILGAISGQLDQFLTEETFERLYEITPGYSNFSFIISLIAFIIFISWLLSFLGVIFKYYDFKLEKTSKEIIITSGLIERKHVTIPFSRIQAVRFVEGIFRQPFGYGMLYVESAGFQQDQQEKSFVIAPYISAKKISGFLEVYLTDFNEPEYHISPPKKAFLRYLRRPNYLVIFTAAILWFFWESWWVLLLFTPLLTLLGWFRYKDAALALGDAILRMRYRVLARTTAFVKKNRIQRIETTANPFQRRRELLSFKTTAASGDKGLDFEIVDLNEKDALLAYHWVTEKEHDVTLKQHPESSSHKNPPLDQV